MMASKSCCCHCKAETTQLRNGWRFVNGSFAKLCETCSFEYENDTFCAKFHLESDGWRNCRICGTFVHCGCIVSLHMYEALDMGGIGCLKCTRQATALIPIQNPSSMASSGLSLNLRNPSEANYLADTDEVISGTRALQNHPMLPNMSTLHSTPRADRQPGTSSDSIAANNKGESSAYFVREALRIGAALRSASTGSPSQVALSLGPQPYNNQKQKGIETKTGSAIVPFEGTSNNKRTSAFFPYVWTNKATGPSDSSASGDERPVNSNLVNSYGQLGQTHFSNQSLQTVPAKKVPSNSLQLFPSEESPNVNQTAMMVPSGDYLAGSSRQVSSSNALNLALSLGQPAAQVLPPEISPPVLAGQPSLSDHRLGGPRNPGKSPLIPSEMVPKKTSLSSFASFGKPAQISPLAANKIVMISKEPNSLPVSSGQSSLAPDQPGSKSDKTGKNKPNNPSAVVASSGNSSQTPPLPPAKHCKRRRSGLEAHYANKSARQQPQSSSERFGRSNNPNPNEAYGQNHQPSNNETALEPTNNHSDSVPFVVSSDILIPRNPEPYVALDPGAVYAERNNLRVSNTEVEPGKPFLRRLFYKELSITDALHKLTCLRLPKLCVEEFFPVIPEGRSMHMTFEDTDGVDWEFKYTYWKNGLSRMYGLDGMKSYRTKMKWKTGDLVTFHKVEPNGKYIIGTKKVEPDPEDA